MSCSKTVMRETLSWLRKINAQLEECGEVPEVLPLYVNERTIVAVERRLNKLREVIAEERLRDARHKKVKRMIARHARKGAQ
jgi:regulator of replication initiation timing